MHVLEAQQFSPEQLEELFTLAEYMREMSKTRQGRKALRLRRRGRIMAALFYEPSTRTRLSFESAAHRLGVDVIGTENAAEFSSAAKGETLEDSTRVVASYADVIVMRHKETGAAARAAAVSPVPVINAGDGTGEHPTQALLDMYTIHKEKGRLRNLHVVIGGDLKHGRTVRSLVRLLALYPNNSITFISPPELRIGDDIKKYLKQQGAQYTETDAMGDALATANVVYWTRTQKERHGPGAKLASTKKYSINRKALKNMKADALIMHPLPRVDEITTEVDDDPRAGYFRQAENGLYARMALLDMVLADR